MRFVIAHKTICQRFTRHQLHLGIERGAHRKAAFVKLLLTEFFEQFTAYFFGEETGRN